MSPSKKEAPASDQETADLFFARQAREILDEIDAVDASPETSRVRISRIALAAVVLLAVTLTGFFLIGPWKNGSEELAAMTWSDLPLSFTLDLEEDPLAAFGEWDATARVGDHSGLPPLSLDSVLEYDGSPDSTDAFPIPLFSTPDAFTNEASDDKG